MKDGVKCGHRRRLPAVESRPKGRKHIWLVGVYRRGGGSREGCKKGLNHSLKCPQCHVGWFKLCPGDNRAIVFLE